ncbi:MAG TPA: Rieske (2Fe-2S) protein [Acidothermaceae bacterium]
MSGGDPHLSRRQLLVIGVGLGTIGCDSAKQRPPCVGPSDGPGIGCLVGLERLTVAGAASLPVGWATIVGADDNNAAIVAHDALGFYALSATCRHQCCTVTLCDGDCRQPIPSPNDCASPRMAQLATSGAAFLCPCHGSTYGADGSVLNGPSIQPLPALAMQIAGADVIVDLSRSVSSTDRVKA